MHTYWSEVKLDDGSSPGAGWDGCCKRHCGWVLCICCRRRYAAIVKMSLAFSLITVCLACHSDGSVSLLCQHI